MPRPLTPEQRAAAEAHLPMAHWVVRRLIHWPRVRRLGFDEALAVAYLALCRVASSWRSDRGALSTFAVPAMREAVVTAAYRQAGAASLDQLEGFEPAAAGVPDDVSDREMVGRMLEAVTPKQAEALQLAFVEDLGLSGAARQVGVFPQAIQCRAARAREHLRERFPDMVSR